MNLKHFKFLRFIYLKGLRFLIFLKMLTNLFGLESSHMFSGWTFDRYNTKLCRINNPEKYVNSSDLLKKFNS